MIKNDILFTGYYGQLNTGDDAFVEVSAWGAKEIWKRDRVTFLGVNRRMPKIINSADGYPFSIPKTYNFQQRLLLKNASYLVSAGGSTFQNPISPGSLKYQAALLAKKGGLKLGAIGVSVGPFASSKNELSNVEYLKHLSFLAVRDKRSYEYVKTLDLPYEPVESFDLAALLPDIYRYDFSKTAADRKIIGISVCNYERYTGGDTANEERRNATIVALLQELDKSINVTFRFFIINGNPHRGDLPLTKEIIAKIVFKNKVEVVEYNRDVKQVWMNIADCDFILTTRLHAGIFACFSNTPFMMVEYHSKCTDFLEDVGQAQEQRLNDADFDIQKIAENIRRLLEEGEKTWSFPSNRKMMADKAYLNFKNITL